VKLYRHLGVNHRMPRRRPIRLTRDFKYLHTRRSECPSVDPHES
jgi:hypothetical protein